METIGVKRISEPYTDIVVIIVAMNNIQHQSGMRSEYVAAAFFSRIGWNVYWSLDSQSRADFVVERGGMFKKVQVKTATMSKAGSFSYLQCRLTNRNKGSKPKYSEEDFDLIIFIYEESLWIADIREILGLTSVCLKSTNPSYKGHAKGYDPSLWLVETH